MPSLGSCQFSILFSQFWWVGFLVWLEDFVVDFFCCLRMYATIYFRNLSLMEFAMEYKAWMHVVDNQHCACVWLYCVSWHVPASSTAPVICVQYCKSEYFCWSMTCALDVQRILVWGGLILNIRCDNKDARMSCAEVLIASFYRGSDVH